MGNVCQGGIGQAPARQAMIFAGFRLVINIVILSLQNSKYQCIL